MVPQWWLVGISGAGVLVAIFTLLVLNSTLQTTKLVAESAKNSIDTSVRITQLDQRAWVGALKVVTVFRRGKQIKAKVVLTNSGKTPALNVTVFGKLIQVDERWGKARFENFRDPDQPRSGSVINPNADIHVKFVGPVPNMKLIQKEKLFVFFFGKAEYSDIFGKSHVTKFCGAYDMKEAAFITCGEYTDAT